MAWSHLVPLARAASPFALLHREMDRLFDDALGGFAARPAAAAEPAEFRPRLDLVETGSELRVDVEVPGLEEQDLDVSLTGDVLVVKGEKRREPAPEGARWHRAERRHGRFERALRLPAEVRADAVRASFARGVLTITLPKAASAPGTARRIEVTS